VDQDPTGRGAGPDDDGAATLDLRGRCVGTSYLLIRPIGQGATGTVWRGVDQTSGEPVAVKLLHDSLLRQPRLVTRFVQERTILLMLRHRHVVRVRDLFSVGDSLGLAMDLVPGGSLRDHLREHHTLAPGEAARLAGQVAAALAEAHELGIIHRDLKPDNILLDPAGDRLETRLTDFGIARMLSTPSLTTSHAVVGTPHYMAPEAFQGSDPSPAADVYALGVLLYELVCGQPPFDSDSVHDLMRQHLKGDVPRRPGLPDPLWKVITSCLRSKPRLRPTAGELVAALSAVADATGDLPALPEPIRRRRSRTADPLRISDPARIPDPVGPRRGHPSLPAGQRVAPRRRNQPANWRWRRPWTTTAVVVGAMLASGAATTVWHLGHSGGEPVEVTAAAAAPTAVPAVVTPAPARTRTTRPRKTTATPVEHTVRPEPAPRRSTERPVEAVRTRAPQDCRAGYTLIRRWCFPTRPSSRPGPEDGWGSTGGGWGGVTSSRPGIEGGWGGGGG
jgi:serine/threonine protein kinase